MLGALLGWWQETVKLTLSSAGASGSEPRCYLTLLRSQPTPTSRGISRWSLQAQVIQAALGDQALRA